MRTTYHVKCYHVNMGSFMREDWATAFAELLVNKGYNHITIEETPCIVSNELEFKTKMKRWSN